MITIGKLAKQYNLSRSTLVYYEKIGLLVPSARGENNYRGYSEKDVYRLEQILKHKRGGVPLKDIAQLLSMPTSDISDILTDRLDAIHLQMKEFKQQQKLILAALVDNVQSTSNSTFDRHSWKQLLISQGFTREDLLDWHTSFERQSPEHHTSFMLALGMTNTEIDAFRQQMLTHEL